MKINDKSIHKETISASRIENSLRKKLGGIGEIDNLTADELISEKWIDYFMVYDDCGYLKEASYKGYGKFKFTMTINNTIIEEENYDFYHGYYYEWYITQEDEEVQISLLHGGHGPAG